MIYLLTGNPGAGKSTVAVQHAIYRYAVKGRPVVANFPIDFAPITNHWQRPLSKASCRVIPDRPNRGDLDSIGFGGETEDTAGVLIIDEAGTWLNARTWQEGERADILDWLTQSRKRYWDLMLIAQSASMLDKQCRDAVCEMVATIRRSDRMRVWGIKMPKMHIAAVHYGLAENAPKIERWIYSGKEAQKCFMSYRLFGADAAHYSVLPATHTKYRTAAAKTPREAIFRKLGIAHRPEGGRSPHRASFGPKLPIVELLARLPIDERIKHWKRLHAGGVFGAQGNVRPLGTG